MSTPLPDRRARAALFRERLAAAMADRLMTQAALARATGVDRSTLSLILQDAGKRLPGTQFLAEAARALGTSADWLLGLTDRPSPDAQMVAPIDLTDAPRALIDATVLGWHHDADGQKIRHVPAGLPDLLKTTAMLAWEAAPTLGPATEAAVQLAAGRQAMLRSGGSDHEIAMPLQEMDNFLEGRGIYATCPADVRAAQARDLTRLTRDLFPRLRLALFDARQIYSVPMTIFGTRMVAVYLGQSYLVLRDRDRLDAMARHFDALVRQARVGDRDVAAHITDRAARAGLEI